MIGEGNGWVCKLDSGRWKRIDDTYFRGYDFGTFPFLAGELSLYKYGGYGFWKTNGLLTSFDFKKKEWEVLSSSRELPTINRFCYFDEETKQLFQLGSLNYNQADNTVSFRDSLYVMSLDKRSWISIGKICRKLDIINPAKIFEPNGITLPLKSGFIFISDKLTPFLVDFKSNTISFFSAVNQERIREFYRQSAYPNVFLVSQIDKISAFDNRTLKEVHSIYLNLISKDLMSTSLTEIEDTTSSQPYLYFGYAVLGIAIAALIGIKLKSKKKLFEKYTILSLEDELKISENYISNYLTKDEFLVLKTIVHAKLTGSNVTTNKINEILGIENRTSDGQKNYRSELIKSINSKIRSNEGIEQDVIVRERSSADKRMITYQCTLKIQKG